MELFDAIPASVFTILTGKNRELYSKALLVTREAFLNNLTIQKEDLVNSIANKLQNDLLDLDSNPDEGITDEDIKSVNSSARTIVNRFKDTGWLESEYAKENKLIELVSLPPYSIKLLDLIYDLCSEEVKAYDSFMYAMYSTLKNADEEYNDYRYLAIVSVYDKIHEFESTLKALFMDLRRHYSRMSRLKSINQLLNEHFDSYQKDIIKTIYLPLKTKDSISRFKGPIMNILTKWLRDKDSLEDIITQSVLHKKHENREVATDEVITKINFIGDKLIYLQELLTSIDEKNQEYVQTATDKMRILLNKDKSIKAKLNSIIAKVANERLDNKFESLDLLQETFGKMIGSELINPESLFVRSSANRDYDNGEEVVIVPFDEDVATSALNKLEGEMNSIYSNEGIQKFMHVQLDELDQINSKDIPINDMNTLILVLYAFVKGFSPRSFYTMNINQGNVDNNIYSIPDVDFIRKR